MSTINGSDKLWYGFRVRKFITYFTKKYGKPEVVLENGSYEQDIARGEGGRAIPVRQKMHTLVDMRRCSQPAISRERLAP